MKALGIDLGTANTYIYSDYGDSLPKPVVLPGISDNTGSISTVVMYEKDIPVLAGNIAEQEYFSQPDLQRTRHLASQFKPELALKNPAAMDASRDFLRIVREALPPGLLTGDTVITVGMPSLAREDYKLNLAQCFRQAGWPEPGFARESDAALVSCLQAGVLNVDDISRKCLILDFGGGTCDYSSVESLDVLQNGGDVLYGGRLFDDLFYQQFCADNPDFAKDSPRSPFAWHAHWLECKREKERFSDFINKDAECKDITLRIVWYDSHAIKREAFLRDYNEERFLQDSENYSASPEMLDILAPYKNRAGLSEHARDLLEGRQTGLISWLRSMLEDVRRRREVSRVIITGGSSRWFFVRRLSEEIFTAAKVIASIRGYEDIAYGLAMYPGLAASQKAADRLLKGQLGTFTSSAVASANEIIGKQAHKVARLCSQRIATRDILPALEAARKDAMTPLELEAKLAAAIGSDGGLMEIVQKSSEELREELQYSLNYEFRRWLKENGVPLAPQFEFPAADVGKDFFDGIAVKISRLDSLNLMSFTLKTILPILAGTATAGAIIHSGEPVSSVMGGGAAFGLTWLLARTAPKILETRKLPAFILNEKNRKKIVEKNQEYIEAELLKSFESLRVKINMDIEMRIKGALDAMIGSLGALNQVRTRSAR